MGFELKHSDQKHESTHKLTIGMQVFSRAATALDMWTEVQVSVNCRIFCTQTHQYTFVYMCIPYTYPGIPYTYPSIYILTKLESAVILQYYGVMGPKGVCCTGNSGEKPDFLLLTCPKLPCGVPVQSGLPCENVCLVLSEAKSYPTIHRRYL